MSTNSQRPRRRNWLLLSVGLLVNLFLPLALMLFFIPLRQVLWGFDDQPLGDVFFWIVAGPVLAIAAFCLICVLQANGRQSAAWTMVAMLAVFDALSRPAAVKMTDYVEHVNTHGILYRRPL